MLIMAWDASLYLKFANERKQPCLDLLSRVDGEFSRILDLGCGPANSTENLLKKFGEAAVTGFDADDDMLENARKKLPGVEFIKGFAPDDFDKLSGSFDLVFSNACIHWIENQEALIKGVYALLNDGGIFAVQIPLTDEAFFYKSLYRLVDEKWTGLRSVKNFHNLDAAGYYNALSDFKNVTVWRTDYYHTVKREDVVEWYKGSGLRPYLERLSKSESEEFLSDLQNIINKEYSFLCDDNVFLVMPRLFFTARK